MLNWYAAHVDKYTEEQRYAMLKKIDHAANRGGNLHIDGHGVENIPSQNGFMFYPNHQGLYDVLAIMEVCPVPFSVVAIINVLIFFNFLANSYTLLQQNL